MDTQAVNNVGNPTVPKPKSAATSSRSEASSTAPPPTGDTVSLSNESLEKVSTSTAASVGSEQRKFALTENHDVVLKVIDSQTQKVVRSVPSEEQLQLRDAIRNELDNI